MKELGAPHLTPRKVADLDREAIEEYGIPGILLMEDAGLGAYWALNQRHRPEAPRHLRVFCGRGNNGGDGFVIARIAHNSGWRVQIATCAGAWDSARDTDAGRNLAIAAAMGIPIHRVETESDLQSFLDGASPEETWVDALLGTGARGEVRGVFRPAIEAIRRHEGPVIAIDIPSGLDGENGSVLGSAVRADLTLTFAVAKTGLLVGSGPELTGELVVVPISIPKEAMERALSGES